MNEYLHKLDQKLDLLLKEVSGLKKLMSKHSALPRDKPLSVREAADYLQLSASRIYTLIAENQLKPNQRMKRSRITFSIEELDSYLNQEIETQ